MELIKKRPIVCQCHRDQKWDGPDIDTPVSTLEWFRLADRQQKRIAELESTLATRSQEDAK